MAPKRARTTSELICPDGDGVIFTKPEHRENYRRLVSRTYLHTAYFKEEMLNHLGLREDIEYMATKIDWVQFLKMKEPAYKSLTYEFLSTLVVEGEQLTFRLGNQDRELTLLEFMGIFGFRFGGVMSESSRHDVDLDEFWHEIAYSPSSSLFHTEQDMSTAIYNPCFRLMQPFLAQTIFGRDPTEDTVMTGELLFLYSMSHRLKLDTSAFIVNHMKKLSVNKRFEGAICIGGIVTSIARYFATDLDGLQPTKISWIDLDTCMEMRMIFKRNSRYYLRVPISTKSWPLPDVANTTVQYFANWKRTFHNNKFGDPVRAWYNKAYCDDDDDVYDDDDEEEEEEEEEEADNEQYSSASAAGSTPNADLRSILDRVKNVELQLQRLNKIEKMMKQVYHWQATQGDLSSPTPPSK